MVDSRIRVGGIEAGGTKIVCALGSSSGEIEEMQSFPTTRPEETWKAIADWFEKRVLPEAFGVGTFGPVELRPGDGYGRILATPKPGWEGFNWVKSLAEAFGKPVQVATDVEAAGLAEWQIGAAKEAEMTVYYTIGTGVGAGAIHQGRILRGIAHSEMGHVAVPVPESELSFPGVCPFHRDCLEGRASGTAIRERWKRPGTELPADHEAWDLEADYFAAALRTLLATLAPDRIVFGGGVSQQEGLLDKIRQQLLASCGGYFSFLQSGEDAEKLIRPASLGQQAGITGSLMLGGP